MSERKLEPKDVPGTFLNLVSDMCIYSSSYLYVWLGFEIDYLTSVNDLNILTYFVEISRNIPF